jgi:uncharacterized protein YdbL (DUF1318 family)
VFITLPSTAAIQEDNLGGIVHIMDGQTPMTVTRFYMNEVGLLDGYLQHNLQNKSTGTSASSDFIATTNSGSDTAEYGDLTRGNVVVDDKAKAAMKQVLARIQDGSFAKEWILENQAGRPSFNAMRRMETEHPIEVVGKKLRSMMPIYQSAKAVLTSKRYSGN